MKNKIKAGAFFLLLLILSKSFNAQADTLRVFSYSILYLGDNPPCQGPHSIYEGYLGSILGYVNPDIVGFVKREPEDAFGTAPAGFADSILQNSFEPYFPGVFAYCPYTNYALGSNITTLYYNQYKLGYAGILCTYSNITDFDTYILYYKSASLATTHDTTYLYITLNHDNSGSSGSSASTRAVQIAGEMSQIETFFPRLPNMINMGDFNTQNSSEACYQTLVAPADTNYRYYDPPFYPDGTYSYPGNWDTDPGAYSAGLTVSTRTSSTAPNACSTNYGGGKLWYDHIFLSSNIINSVDKVSYIPHSFKVIGNDGNRLGNPENGSPANTSAPSAVINAIFQMSEHYPISLDLYINDTPVSVAPLGYNEDKVTVINPVVGRQFDMQFTNGLIGKTINITCIDVLGRVRIKNCIQNAKQSVQIPCDLNPGVYYLIFYAPDHIISQVTIQKI